MAIRWLRRYAVDNLPLERYHEVILNNAIKSHNKRIAIVGGGPGGLAAAYFLSVMGYKITIFEEKEKLGGVMLGPSRKVGSAVFDFSTGRCSLFFSKKSQTLYEEKPNLVMVTFMVFQVLLYQ